ncbi:GCN5-related N-acetyltransferase [Pyrobaculum islandicum DSM 4184]|uniref:GCN5-related N-acetyltransferase n=1 Tax=Pyrobaculum islandicum (strain DSM 4184 / JCM 9189 / GEO3) TaxID=384616 RepID=A1RRT4_PYRIL|nr:GNAT family N-acetyltransferase [Pyrobaculum islandicum]ABL87666.1 GCN5-related N-acetyltransferase [Pyrobaculum islandicum DSM 4184]
MEFVIDRETALRLVGLYYRGPVKYAKAVLERWPGSNAVTVYIDGEPVGAEVFYAVRLAEMTCVHYYIVVAPKHRRRGIATSLVRYVEGLCGASTYLATSAIDNVAVARLFEKLGYARHAWRELPPSVREVLLKATCGYDDDVLYIKGGKPEEIAAYTGDVEVLWRETCLKPYLGV